MQNVENGGWMSPGLGHTNANWNSCLNNASGFGEEGYSGSKKHYQPVETRVLKTPQPKTKEPSRLNKFPLDLDSLVSSTTTTSPTKTQGGFLSPNTPKPPPRSTGGLQHHTSSPSASTSPSASLSSLDGASDTPPLSLHHPFFPVSPRSVPQLEGSIPSSEICSQGPLSPAESPQQKSLSGPKVAEVVPFLPPSSPFSPRAIWSVADSQGDGRDSVGSILQRIASFSQHAVTDTTPAALTQAPTVQSNGGLSSEVGCPAVTILKEGRKPQGKMF